MHTFTKRLLYLSITATILITCILAGLTVEKSNAKYKNSGGISIIKKKIKPQKITITKNGKARIPKHAPKRIKRIIRAANKISHTPYKWGGGHGRWRDSGYDCSGSVSFALRGAGLISSSRTSGGLMSWGKPGKGKWVTVYAHGSHTFMIFRGGIKFDTSGASPSRWQKAKGTSLSGYTTRHPRNL